MQYARLPYMAEGVVTQTRSGAFSPAPYTVPVIDYPITPLENFKLSWKHQTPVWAPISMLDFENVSLLDIVRPFDLADGDARPEFLDDWGCEWVYVPVAGGPMLKPGTQRLADITLWESELQFPDWASKDHKSPAEAFYKNRLDPGSVLAVNVGQGCTERLVAVMGGYEEAMLAMAEEPEAVAAFFEAFIDNLIERYDIIKACYPDVGMITYHDDWGTEKDTFFSEKYFEDMVYAPTKRFIDHVKASGDVCFQLHSCGKIERFMPYIIDIGVDLLQIQRRANDMPMLKEKYGDKVGFCCMLENVESGVEIPLEERLEKLRLTIDLYGKKGGLYLTLGMPDDETLWASCFEAYCYSREYYDKEREAK